MKTVKEFCNQNGLIFMPINYKDQGITVKRKGFDICRKNGEIIISFEPKDYRKNSIYYKDKWMIRHSPEGYNGNFYFSRITKKFLQSLDLSKTTKIFCNIPK